MAYDSATGKVSEPVGLDDIQDAIGSTEAGIIALCKSANVNMWAKYKPVLHPSLSLTGKASGSEWWKGDDRSTAPYLIAGLEFPGMTSLGTFNKSLQGKITCSAGFLYKLMRGQYSWQRAEPHYCRYLDFDGYYDAAISPLPTPPASGSYEFHESYIRTMIAGIPHIEDVDNLHLSDMQIPSAVLTVRPTLNTFRIALCFWKADYSDMFWASAEEPINVTTDDKHLHIPVGNLNTRAGDWKCAAFLTNADVNSDVDWSGLVTTGVFLIADASQRTITFVDRSGATHQIIINSAKWVAVAQGVPTTLHVSIDFKNNGSSVNLRNIQLVFHTSYGTVTKTVSNRTLGAGQTYTFSQNYTDIIYAEGVTLQVSARFQNETITVTEAVTG